MGLYDKKVSDWTPRDAVNVWSLTGAWDALQILMVIPLFFWRGRKSRSVEEIRQSQKESDRQMRRRSLYRSIGINE